MKLKKAVKSRKWKKEAEQKIRYFAGKGENPVIKERMEKLYPGQNAERKYQDYRIKKARLMLTMVIMGILSAVCAHLCSRMQTRLTDGRYLDRNEWGKGNYSVTLSAETESWKGEVTPQIRERRFLEEELLIMDREAAALLEEVMRGNNTDLFDIREDLNLVRGLEGYPFLVTWESSSYERIGINGTVSNEDLKKDEQVTLKAIFSYEEKRWEHIFEVTVKPKVQSPEKQKEKYLEELFEKADQLYETKQRIMLPDRESGEAIVWKEKQRSSAPSFLLLGLAGFLFLSWGMDRDLKKRELRRKEELLKCYPEFVSKLLLYMGAGLTVKNAFLKIGQDYREEKNRTGKMLYLYEEVLISSSRFLNGEAESRAYRNWGKRCDEVNCRKLGFLLSAHVRQGNDKVLSMLSEEVRKAMEEKKNQFKKQGEEACTKLVFPMMLMLIEVMFLILLPAFTGLGSM